MKTKIIILILSVIYCSFLLITLTASHYQSVALNPLNSEYYYKKGLFAKAIEIEPAKAEYHMLYALDLIRQNPRPDADTRRLILVQLTQAVELLPFSENYRNIYNIYAPLLNP